MAVKIKKKVYSFDFEIVKPYVSLIIRYSHFFVPSLIMIIFILTFVFPSTRKITSYKSKIREKIQNVTTVTAGKAEIEKTKKDLESFKLKVKEFEKRLPKRLKTTLIIETLQEITKQANLKFSSLKPAPLKKHILPETNDVFVELPVVLKLECGYYELIDFLKKLETTEQLMQVTNLSIRDNPGQEWDHIIEFSVSAFSKGEGNE